MLLRNECFCTFRNPSLVLNFNKVRKPNQLPCRLFFNWRSSKREDSNSEKASVLNNPEKKPLSIFEDEGFSEHLKESFRDINIQKRGFRNLMSECKRFYKEEISTLSSKTFTNLEIDSPHTKVHILHKFENPEDLKDFSVQTDSSCNMGYSSASFKLTSHETAIFSGNICTNIPKTGDIDMAGYANLQFPKQKRAFFRVKKYDWSDYTHLVFKIRGDGRSYLVILHTPHFYKELSYHQYSVPLYTRGGPYWQIAKLPFSYFYLTRKGRLHDLQSGYVPLHDIINMSLTVGAYDGPFKLEIDYIGLEHKDHQKTSSPFEQYSI